MQANTVTRIDKSVISNILFRNREILESSEDISLRSQDLSRAMSLGNLFKEKVRIQFETSYGELMETEATIWSVTEKNVLLKGGLMIPIHSISKVTL